MTPVQAKAMTDQQWLQAINEYLSGEMDRLRLLLQRRTLWIRKRWGECGDSGRTPAMTSGWAISDQEAELLLKPDAWREESLFYQSDPEAVDCSAAIDIARGAVEELLRNMEQAGRPAPIDVLASRFGLTAFERNVLLLCLAPELDSSFERLFAYVQDDPARKFATPHLALSLFGADQKDSHRASFLDRAPLRRWRLLAFDSRSQGARLSSAMGIDERILNFLSGLNQVDPRCSAFLAPSRANLLPECHRTTADELARYLAGARNSAPIHLMGPPGSGRQALAQAAARQAGFDLIVLDPRLLPSSVAERRELMELIEREAVLLASALFCDADSLKPEEASLVAQAQFSMPVLIASCQHPRHRHQSLTIQVGRPDAASQQELWARALGSSAAELQPVVNAIVEQFDLGPAAIEHVVSMASQQASLQNSSAKLTDDDLWLACRSLSAPNMDQLARRIEPAYGWDDIVVPPPVLAQLRELAAQVANRHHIYQAWGFGKKLTRGRGISALFSGPSGVGKTMAAEVIALHLKLDLYRIDLAGMVSKYIGETEKNLRSVFDSAEQSGAILFFDEADALFGKRSEVKDSHDRYANIEVNYLLQRMEDYRGVAILATNMRASMDAAFTRRLRFIIDFPFPDAMHRMEIWRRVFPAEALVDGINLAALSRLEISGGNIRNIAVNAAFLAAAEGSAIGMDQIIRAARREYAKIDRLILDSEFGHFSGASRQ